MVEFFVFRGVSGCLWSNAIRSGCMPVAIFSLLNVPCVSASDDEDTINTTMDGGNKVHGVEKNLSC